MKKQFEGKDPIAVFGLSNVAGIAVLEIDDTEERVYYRIDTIDTKGKVRFGKLYNNEYFRTTFGNVYLNECIRVF